MKKKTQSMLEAEPMITNIFRLYYLSPEQAKITLEDLFSTQGEAGVSTMSNLKITVEKTTRSIIVRGHEPDLDVIDKVIQKIDIKTKQAYILLQLRKTMSYAVYWFLVYDNAERR